jgi:sugar phosphate isomerase/epimerase
MQSKSDLSRRQFLARTAAVSVASMPALSLAVSAPAIAEKRAKLGWQVGCYTRPWADYEYPVAFDAIAEAGFKYVGLMTTKSSSHLVISEKTTPEEAERVAEDARKRGLKVSSVYGGDIPVKESLEAGIAGMRRLIDNCVTVKATSLLMGGIGDEKLKERYYKAIAECCDYAASKKLEITVKPHGGTNATGPQCRKCIEQVNHPNFTIWYDPGNIFYYSDGKLDPVDDAATVDGIVSGMSVKDYEHPKKVDLTPGTGKVNFEAVLKRLKKGGLTGGSLVIECLAVRESLPDRLAEARKAKAFIEQVVARI